MLENIGGNHEVERTVGQARPSEVRLNECLAGGEDATRFDVERGDGEAGEVTAKFESGITNAEDRS